jgi:hypothetical protein
MICKPFLLIVSAQALQVVPHTLKVVKDLSTGQEIMMNCVTAEE